MNYWCRKCRKGVHHHGDQWAPTGGPVPRPKSAEIVVCSLCFHRARLIDGVDLSRPVIYPEKS